jgi:hypothetical protein
MFHFQNFQAYINKQQWVTVNDEIRKIFKEISMKRSYDLRICYVVFIYIDNVTAQLPSRRCLHFEVVGGLKWSNDPESYAGGSVATGRASLAGKVKGDGPG